MEILLSLTALAVAFAGGLGAVLLLRSRSSQLDICGVVGTSLIAGAGIVPISSFFLGLLYQGRPLQFTVVGICLGLAFFGWRRNHRDFQYALPRFSWSTYAQFAMLAIGLAVITWFSLYRTTLQWDGLFNWESKARVAFQNHGAIPLIFYTSYPDFFSLSYPPLVPMLEVWMYGFLGQMDQSAIKLIGPFFYLAAGLLLISAVSTETKDSWPGVFAISPFLLAPLLSLGPSGPTSGYADFPLSVIYLGITVHLLEYCRTRREESARLAGLCCLILAFVKADALILLICIGCALIPLTVQEHDWKAFAWILGPGIGMWLCWKLLMKALGVPPESAFQPFTLHVLLSHLYRGKPIIGWVLEEIFTLSHWSLLWPYTAWALIFLLVRGRMSEWFPWASLVILPFFLFSGVYLFSAWNPVEDHVKSSLPRLLMQVASSAALLVGLSTARLLNYARSTHVTAERVDALWKQAEPILAPLGITERHFRLALLSDEPDPVIEQAADSLRVAGVGVDRIRMAYALMKAESEESAALRASKQLQRLKRGN